jgi:beta-xylosidase
MAICAADAIGDVNPDVIRVLGGISPIDPLFIRNMQGKGVLNHVEAIAVHGFPLDWNLWKIDEWPQKLAEIQSVTDLPVWVSEVGVSTFGAEEVQLWGLPQEWGATTRHKEAEGSSYYRHFYMGLIRADGTPKPALEKFAEYTPDLGICQWFHFEDPRLDEGVAWLKRLGVTQLRTGLSWADSFRPGALDWFDRQMEALADFDVTLTLCFTPEHRGILPHHTSAPQVKEEFAEFCANMIERYAGRARERVRGVA